MKPFDWLWLALCFSALVIGLMCIIREDEP